MSILANIKSFLRPFVYRVIGRDQQPDSFLDCISGVIHIGANTGQERDLYRSKNLQVLWVEPIPAVYEVLESNLRDYPRQSAVQALLYEKDGVRLSLNVASNGGESSSIMGLKEHKILWPDIAFVESIEMTSKTLVTLVEETCLDLGVFNAIVLDTQGSELLILKGAIPLLPGIAFIKTEVPDFEAYEGCPDLSEFTAFMAQHGFRLVSKRAIPASTRNRAYYDVTYKNKRLSGGF